MPRRRTALPQLVRKVARRCSVHVVATVRPSPHLFMSTFAQPAPAVHTPWPALRTLISGTGPLLAARAPRLRWPGADNDPPMKTCEQLHHLVATEGSKRLDMSRNPDGASPRWYVMGRCHAWAVRSFSTSQPSLGHAAPRRCLRGLACPWPSVGTRRRGLEIRQADSHSWTLASVFDPLGKHNSCVRPR